MYMFYGDYLRQVGNEGQESTYIVGWNSENNDILFLMTHLLNGGS